MDTATQESKKSTPAGKHASIREVLDDIRKVTQKTGVSPLTHPKVFWTDADQAVLTRLIKRFSKAETDGLVVIEAEDIVVLTKYLTLMALRADYHIQLINTLRDEVGAAFRRLDVRTDVLRLQHNEVVAVLQDDKHTDDLETIGAYTTLFK